MSDYYTPSQVSERFGISLDTLRYYEREGLLSPVERAPSGHRRYRRGDVELLDLIRCLRDTDMPIATLRSFAELVRAGDPTIPDRVELLQRHDDQLTARIATLIERRAAIKHKIDYYRGVIGAAEEDERAASETVARA
ncbi:MerR family transcriptional regulator [Allonocardiopsis opalescens]|uniref:DNA-binding transcriptional MerR regulator n=1 Tax=Allonocardiopsis opalescens TaxID=1144618 RepID=A0A2T0Q4L3_9ACTN|nr:MerR family transcriptional regulator [Allonocardiopsis opalescens]PRX98732.1 DNA-binding transcriptional MerR regulator [Allonocardiopsis opalescens]